jgi:hypothetical protein
MIELSDVSAVVPLLCSLKYITKAAQMERPRFVGRGLQSHSVIGLLAERHSENRRQHKGATQIRVILYAKEPSFRATAFAVSLFSRDQLKRAASLTEEDFVQLGKCRRPHNRLGFAYQVAFVRLFEGQREGSCDKTQ